MSRKGATQNAAQNQKQMDEPPIWDREAWQKAERALERLEAYRHPSWEGYYQALATARRKVERFRFFFYDSVGGKGRMIARKRFRFRDLMGRITPDGFELYPPDYMLSRHGNGQLSTTTDAAPTNLESQLSHSERLREINRRNAEFWNARKEQR